MRRLCLRVDRIEEDVAVCYAPDGGELLPVPLPSELCNAVHDGDTVAVCFDGDSVISVSLCDRVDAAEAEKRRLRLKGLFDRK